MNAKKAKRLRQLLRHLAQRSGTELEQVTYTQDLPGTSVRLGTDCARALYQQMKAVNSKPT